VTAAEAPHCIFCHARTAEDAAPLVVHRGAICFVVLNLYPYNNGHLMVVPNRHIGRSPTRRARSSPS